MHGLNKAGSGSRLTLLPCLLLALVISLAGCATARPPTNKAISRIDESAGYRIPGGESERGEDVLLLAFSGGGTRAAALSYGVMQELRDTLIPTSNGSTIRLLDEVDIISSVSGGSFTAAYYGLYRDRLFEDYERDFLRQGVQQALITQLFNPAHWIRSAFAGFNRTEMAVDYYNRIMFYGATFADLEKNGRPFIAINATDLGSGQRFTFTQGTFDLICTDLGSYPVARAVTASSAVPLAFPPIVLENHAADCAIDGSTLWQQLERLAPESAVQQRLVEGLKSYRDADRRKYIHLLDGGIADNLGLRVVIDRVESLRQLQQLKLPVRNILVILVNAEVNPEQLIEQTAAAPSIGATMGAVTSAQFKSYNRETLDRFRQTLADINQLASAEGLLTRVYFAEVSFEHIKLQEINRLLNTLPTTLELEDIDVDRLIVAGRLLLRYDPSFQDFKQHNDASLAPGAISEDVLCQYFDHSSCTP